MSGSTTLSKVPLSYKWILNDAEIVLANSMSFGSPLFSLTLPGSAENSWFLTISQSFESEDSFCFRLRQGDDEDAQQQDRDPTILISDCVFSFVHPETSEPLFSTTCTPPRNKPRPHLMRVNECPKTCCETKDIGCSEISKHVFDGTLIVQVNATVVCLDDRIEMHAGTSKIPVDNIREEMNSLYMTRVLTDATIKCGTKEFEVHKAFLVSQSPVFRKMFEVDMEERKSNIIDVQDISPAVMSDLVAYFYTGTVPNINNIKMAKELLNAADKYEIPRLFSMCESELEVRIKVANVVELFSLADLHSAGNLKRACVKFVHLKLAEIQKTSMWKDLKDQNPALLVEIMEQNVC